MVWYIRPHLRDWTNLSAGHFIFNLRNYDEHWQVRVLRHNVPGAREQIVNLPMSSLMDRILGHALAEPTGQMRCHVSTWLQLR